MREILKFDNGLRWVLIETSREAQFCDRLVRMGLSFGFDFDKDKRLASRYYVLTNEETAVGHVMVRDGNDHIMFTTPEGKLVWGNHFSHPWPEFGDEIAALSKRIGVELVPEQCPTAATPSGPRM
jgi:hypothetical protein